jgi:hypothetical protein
MVDIVWMLLVIVVSLAGIAGIGELSARTRRINDTTTNQQEGQSDEHGD